MGLCARGRAGLVLGGAVSDQLHQLHHPSRQKQVHAVGVARQANGMYRILAGWEMCL